MSYGRSSKKEYELPPSAKGIAAKHFKPGGKSKAKDYESQLAEKLDTSE
jgi:hypothetical protein